MPGLRGSGAALPLSERVGQAQRPAPRRLLDPVAAWYVGNILIGAPPPENAPRGRIAFKTGTSYGYRDAWAVGFDGRMTIGVWVGRPDGAPVPGLVGRAAAAPILFDAFARTGQPPAPLPRAPKGAVFATSDKLPPPLQRFSADAQAAAQARDAAAHHVPAERRAARARRGDGSPIRSRSRSPAARGRSPCWSTACRCRRSAAAARCSSSPTGRASCG